MRRTLSKILLEKEKMLVTGIFSIYQSCPLYQREKQSFYQLTSNLSSANSLKLDKSNISSFSKDLKTIVTSYDTNETSLWLIVKLESIIRYDAECNKLNAPKMTVYVSKRSYLKTMKWKNNKILFTNISPFPTSFQRQFLPYSTVKPQQAVG